MAVTAPATSSADSISPTPIEAIGVGEILSALEVAGAVTAILITLGGICDLGGVEGAMMYPAALNGSGKIASRLYALHTYAVLGHVSEGDVSDLKASAEAAGVIGGLTHEVKSPAVNGSVIANTLDGDVLAALHARHKAVVALAAAVVLRVKGGKSLGVSWSV